MSTTPTVASLLAGLDALQATLQADDLQAEALTRADALVVEHDRDLRDLLHGNGIADTAREDLERLQRAQRSVLARMSHLHAQAAREMHAFEQSERAARAYRSLA